MLESESTVLLGGETYLIAGNQPRPSESCWVARPQRNFWDGTTGSYPEMDAYHLLAAEFVND